MYLPYACVGKQGKVNIIVHDMRGRCQMEQEKIIEEITTLKGSMKTAYNRLDSIDSKIDAIENKQDVMHEMNANIRIIALNQENQSKEIVTIKTDVKELKEKPNPDIDELKCEVKELKARPGKRWDTLITVIITVIVSGILGFVLGKVFGG